MLILQRQPLLLALPLHFSQLKYAASVHCLQECVEYLNPLGTHLGGGRISATQSQGIAGALITSGTRCCKAYIKHLTLCTSNSGMSERCVSTLHRFRALQGQEQSPNCVSPRHVIYM